MNEKKKTIICMGMIGNKQIKQEELTLSKELTKELVIDNKKDAIKKLNKLLENYINDPSEKHLKKANLISYWVKDFTNYINKEESFEPTRNIAYKRGNVVKLNFGFNVGSEYGGLHYAIVLDIDNAHNSPVVTVIPLTSAKDDKEIHDNSVFLGNEIYRMLKLKHDTLQQKVHAEMEKDGEILSAIDTLIDFSQIKLGEALSLTDGSPEQDKVLASTQASLDLVDAMRTKYEEKQKERLAELEYLDKIRHEISRMKEGSVALVNQITTVSKMRIFDPKNTLGVLSGVSLSAEGMEKINEKVKKLYTF